MDEEISIEKWAEEYKTKVDRFVDGYNTDKAKTDGSTEGIPETLTRSEWVRWLKNFEV